MSKKLTEVQKVRRAWVRALLSGKYKQTAYILHNKNSKGQDRFCCLGVLCELAVKAKVIDPAEFDEDSGHFTYDGDEALLPKQVMKWAGINDSAGSFVDIGNEGERGESLTYLNDHGKKFKTIAKIIESEPEGLFKN